MPKEKKKKDNKVSKHAYKKKTAWEIFTKPQIKKAYDFCEDYKKFLNVAKTEEIRRLLRDAGAK